MIPENFIPALQQLAIASDTPNLVEQIKDKTKNGYALQFIDGDGYFIIEPIYNKSGQAGMLIWLGIHGNPKESHQSYLRLEQLAISTKMKFIRFETHRKGFKRLALRFGFKPVRVNNKKITYEKEV